VDFAVLGSGSPVSGVSVFGMQYEPFSPMSSTGTTDSTGHVKMNLDVPAVYR